MMDKKNISDITDNLSEILKETLQKLTGSEDIDAMKESAQEVANEATAFVRKYPVQTLLGAVAVGFILGSLASKRK